MPKKRETNKIPDRHIFIINVLSAAVLILFLLIIFRVFIVKKLSGFVIRFESSIEKEVSSETPVSSPSSGGDPAKPGNQTSPSPTGGGLISQVPLQGSFGESFSGVGWRNPVNSNVYQDFKTLTISFPLAYDWEEISSAELIIPAEKPQKQINLPDTFYSTSIKELGSRVFVGGVKKVGEQYEGYLYEFIDGELIRVDLRGYPRESASMFTSQYPGKIVFGSDGPSKLFLLYAAYQSKAYELRVDSIVSIETDYSNIFNTRVTENGNFNPKIIYKDGAWWISSTGSSAPKFLRIRNGVATDFTPLLLEKASQFELIPASGENTFYGVLTIGGERRVFRFRDLGFRVDSRINSQGFASWESLRLNAWEGEIIRGRFTWIDDSIRSGFTRIATQNDAEIKYFLSNDGGRNWMEAELNKFVQFEAKGGSPRGEAGDFRWRAELYSSQNQYESPWIKTIGVEYYIIRK